MVSVNEPLLTLNCGFCISLLSSSMCGFADDELTMLLSTSLHTSWELSQTGVSIGCLIVTSITYGKNKTRLLSTKHIQKYNFLFLISKLNNNLYLRYLRALFESFMCRNFNMFRVIEVTSVLSNVCTC